jgi:hypothetical protein
MCVIITVVYCVTHPMCLRIEIIDSWKTEMHNAGCDGKLLTG